MRIPTVLRFVVAALMVAVSVPAASQVAVARPRVSAGGTLTVQVAGRAGVPADAAAAVLNVTVTRPRRPGWAVVYPCGAPFPLASNVNYVAGQNVPNLVVTGIGTGGRVCITSNQATDLVVDLQGWFPAGADLHTMTPARLLDTRLTGGRIPAGGDRTIGVAGMAGVPATAAAAVVNLTVTDPLAAGWVAGYPAGQPLPVVSNVNYVAGQTVANLAILTLGAGGAVTLHSLAATHLVVDVMGWFGSGATYHAAAPQRLVDTRLAGGRLPAGGVLAVGVAGMAGVPADARAAALNVTVTEPAVAGWAVVYPCGQPRPWASNLNYAANQTVAAFTVPGVGTGGQVCVFVQQSAHVVVDRAGWFVAGSSYHPVTPVRLVDTRELPWPAGPLAEPLAPLPAGGLYAGGRPPQFVVVSFDGAGDPVIVTRFRDLARAEPVRYTFFLAGYYLFSQATRTVYQPPGHPAGTSPGGVAVPPAGYTAAQWIRAIVEADLSAGADGHEIGTHFAGHFCDTATWPASWWRQELDQVELLAANVSANNGIVPPVDNPLRNGIGGVRTPCLAGDFAVVDNVLAERAIHYDASLVHGERQWPRAYGSVWRMGPASVPIAGTTKSTLAADYNLDVSVNGGTLTATPARAAELRAITRDTYRAYFERSYHGNRAPVEIMHHTQPWASNAYHDGLIDVLTAVCGLPEVQCVSYDMLTDWLDDHAAQIPAFERGEFPKLP